MPIVQLLLDYVRRNSNFPVLYTINPQHPKWPQIYLTFTYYDARSKDANGPITEQMTEDLLITPTRTVEEVWDWIQVNDYAEERRRRGAGRTPQNLKRIDLPELTLGEAA